MNPIVLMYHDIFRDSVKESGLSDDSADVYKVSESNFRSQVKAISDYLVNNNLSKDRVIFTFDDGGVSFLRVVAPILEEYCFTGLFFIITNRIGAEGFLSVDDIIDLKRRGHIIGSHSHSHPDNISVLQRDQIDEEWQESVSFLNNLLGVNVEYASIPNGYQSNNVLNSANQCGLRYLYTSTPTTKRKKMGDMIVIGRYVVLQGFSSNDVIKVISKPGYRTYLYLRWSVLNLLHHILGTKYESIKTKILKRLRKD